MERQSAKDAVIKFNCKDYSNDNDLWDDARGYLSSLPDTADKLFPCPYLRKLIQSVGIISEGRPSVRLEKGDYICTRTAEAYGGALKCCPKSEKPIREEEGNLVLHCGIGNVDIVVKPVRTNGNTT